MQLTILTLSMLLASTVYAHLAADNETSPKRCGPNFQNKKCSNRECCSHAGYCGTGSDYCSVPGNCHRAFGRCDSDTWPDAPIVTYETSYRHLDKSVPAIITQCTKPKTLALTYDDGPTEFTPMLLDVLDDFNAKATFFVAGNINGKGSIDQQKWATIIRDAFQRGHQIGSHTWSHPHMSKISTQDRYTEIIKTESALNLILGKAPRYLRAPYIDCTVDSGCQKDMKDLGLQLVEWQYDSEDWRTPRASLETALASLMPHISGDGSAFIIQHDSHAGAVELTRSILERIPSDWKAVTMSECLGGEEPYRSVDLMKRKRSTAAKIRPFW